MKHIAAIALLLTMVLPATSQVRRIVTPEAPKDTTPQLSILFNNTVPPSHYLDLAGRQHRYAFNTAIIGSLAGAALAWYGYTHDLSGSDARHPVFYLGLGTIAASGIAFLVLEYLSALNTQRAGEQLRRISISYGGISYHF